MRAVVPTLLSLSLLALSPLAGASSPATDPRIEHLLTELGKVRPIDAVQLSPDGQRLAWVVRTHGKPSIQIARTDGSGAHRLDATHPPGLCSESDIAWAPDSRHLAFLSDCAGKAGSRQMDIQLADTAGHDPTRQLSHLHGYAHALQWSADGRALAFLYVEGATRRASAVAAAKPPSGEIGVDGLEVQRVAWQPVDGSALRQLTPADRYVYEFSLSPDSDQLAYVGAPAPGDNNWWIAKLYVQPTRAGAGSRLLVDPVRRRRSPAPDADRAAAVVAERPPDCLHRRIDERPGRHRRRHLQRADKRWPPGRPDAGCARHPGVAGVGRAGRHAGQPDQQRP